MDKNYASGWNELTTKNSWMLFKIMGEFVQGFEKMGHHNPCISIFGSARTQTHTPIIYWLMKSLNELLI